MHDKALRDAREEQQELDALHRLDEDAFINNEPLYDRVFVLTPLSDSGELSQGVRLHGASSCSAAALLRCRKRGSYTGLSSTCRDVQPLGHEFLAARQLPVTIDLLKKAEVLTQRHHPVERATTLNNFACYYRRLGKLHAAMTIEHVRCSIAAGEAPRSLGARARSTYYSAGRVYPQHAHDDVTADNSTGDTSSARLDRISVMCIAYHNIGVEQEFLKEYAESVASYKKGVGLAEQYLGGDHSITTTIRNSYLAAKRMLATKAKVQPIVVKRVLNPRSGSLRMPSPLVKEKDHHSGFPTPRSIITDALSRAPLSALPPLEVQNPPSASTKKKTAPGEVKNSAPPLSPTDPFFSPRFRFDDDTTQPKAKTLASITNPPSTNVEYEHCHQAAVSAKGGRAVSRSLNRQLEPGNNLPMIAGQDYLCGSKIGSNHSNNTSSEETSHDIEDTVLDDAIGAEADLPSSHTDASPEDGNTPVDSPLKQQEAIKDLDSDGIPFLGFTESGDCALNGVKASQDHDTPKPNTLEDAVDISDEVTVVSDSTEEAAHGEQSHHVVQDDRHEDNAEVSIDFADPGVQDEGAMNTGSSVDEAEANLEGGNPHYSENTSDVESAHIYVPDGQSALESADVLSAESVLDLENAGIYDTNEEPSNMNPEAAIENCAVDEDGETATLSEDQPQLSSADVGEVDNVTPDGIFSANETDCHEEIESAVPVERLTHDHPDLPEEGLIEAREQFFDQGAKEPQSMNGADEFAAAAIDYEGQEGHLIATEDHPLSEEFDPTTDSYEVGGYYDENNASGQENAYSYDVNSVEYLPSDQEAGDQTEQVYEQHGYEDVHEETSSAGDAQLDWSEVDQSEYVVAEHAAEYIDYSQDAPVQWLEGQQSYDENAESVGDRQHEGEASEFPSNVVNLNTNAIDIATMLQMLQHPTAEPSSHAKQFVPQPGERSEEQLPQVRICHILDVFFGKERDAAERPVSAPLQVNSECSQVWVTCSHPLDHLALLAH
ncbi:hypothetical protein GQ600_27785 [Phytophthora cactorum]|nr:hypothetical protein GQ600_27785 [Phytophthora cactorum]